MSQQPHNCERCGRTSCLCRARIGDNLERRIPEVFKGKSGCDCDANKNLLNRKTPEEVRAELPSWVSTLVESASKFHIPEIISRAVAQKWLVASIEEAERCLSEYREQFGLEIKSVRDMRSRKPM